MRLRREKKTGSIAGLEIESGTIAAVELGSGGAVATTAVGPVAPGAFLEGEVIDQEALADSLRSVFAENKLARRVRLGIGNQRVVVRTMRLPAIEDPKEMDAAVRFQAQEQIPMPLDQAVLDYQVVGGVPAEEGAAPQLDVVVVAARREMVEAFLSAMRRAGLEPVGIDLSAFGMIRAFEGIEAAPLPGGEGGPAAGDAAAPATLYCSVGDVSNLAVVRERSCLFTRVSQVGLGEFAAQLGAARGLDPEVATQWLHHVGLEAPAEAIEGDPETVADARRVLELGVGSLVDELRMSLEYYATQEGVPAVGRIVLCGPGSTLAGLPAAMEGVGLPLTVERPGALASLDQTSAARLTLPYGLALGA